MNKLLKSFALLALLGTVAGCSGLNTSAGNLPSQPNGSQPSPSFPLGCQSDEFKRAYDDLADRAPVPLDDTKVHEWPPLPNIGNTCFMNSALKLMARQKTLLKRLEMQDEKALATQPYLIKSVEQAEERATLRRAFRAVINMIRLGQTSPAQDAVFARCSLEAFRESMKKLEGLQKFTTCRQKDAVDFMNRLGDLLSLRAETPNNMGATFSAKQESLDSFVNSDLGGQEPFDYNLGADFLAGGGVQSLSDLIKADTLLKQSTVDFVIQRYITGIDKSLIIVVQAGVAFGSQDIRKGLVRGSEELTIDYRDPLTREMVKTVRKASDLPKNNMSKVMHLAAVVVHIGSTRSGGHYVVYVKDKNKGWTEHNDGSPMSLYDKNPGDIEKIVSGVAQPQAYLYLYEE